jgi:hypothetical protein
LTEDEKMTIARWIDLGCPISSQDPAIQASGWFADELRPTLTLSSPRPGVNPQVLQTIRIGAYDSYSGIDRTSLSVIASFPINGKAATSELGRDFSETGDHIWTLQLAQPASNLTGTVTVRIRDLRGNWSTIVRDFTVSTSSRCDLNGDATVNVLDVQRIVLLVLGLVSGSPGEGDLNRDGRVDVLDVQTLLNVVLGLRTCPA